MMKLLPAKSNLLILLALLVLSVSATASITYPTQYPSTKYLYTFYQTNVSTTLNASITRGDTSLNLTDASGFSVPGMLYFPSDGEIMHINSISGNTVTVNRDPRYTAGSGRFAHSAGETVVFAHFQYKGADASVDYFQNTAHVGDFVLFGSVYYLHFLESVELNLSTTASYSSAEFEGFELNYVSGTSADAEYWIHQMPIKFYDGTNGFRQNGTISFENHESGLYDGYNNPINSYNYIYDESGNRALGFYVGVRLKNASDWTQGATGTRTYYEKVFRPTGESGLSWSYLYQKDKTTPLSLAKDDILHRQMVLYDDKKMPLDISVSGYSASGNITIMGLQNDENLYMYFPFVKGTGWTIEDLRNYKEFIAWNGLNIPYGSNNVNYAEASDDVYWTDGQFSGKKALHIQDKYILQSSSDFQLKNAYGKIGDKFSVEAVVNAHSNGTIFTMGTQDYYLHGTAYPFRLVLDKGVLKAEVSTDAGNFFATDSSFSSDAWHYVVFTYDGASLRLYVDGSLVDTTATSGTLLYSDTYDYFNLGGEDSAGTYWNGEVSEIAVWNNRVLTDSEISARNTKQQTEYLQQVSENVSVSANGVYTTSNDFSYILDLSHTGTYDYNLAQPRLNIIGKTGQKYTIYTDFGLDDSTFTDTSNSQVQVGVYWTYNLRAFNMGRIRTGSFTLGKDVSGTGYSGGTLILYNTYAQGTYRNYLQNSYFYGTNIYIYTNSLETNPPVAFLDCTFNSLRIGSGVSFIEGAYSTISKDTDVWHGNTYINIWARNIQYKSFYNPDLTVAKDEDTVFKTADETQTLQSPYYIGGYRMGITTRNDKSGGYGYYDYHYKWKSVLVNFKMENGSFYVYPRGSPYNIYGSPTLGYTFKLKVVDDEGNPVEGAKVYITDKDGYSAIFRPVGHAAQQYLYGSNYGGVATTLAVEDGTKYSVGDVIDIYGERAEVTAISENTLTITRAVQDTGDAYALHFSQDSDYSHSWIERQQPYLVTNASGEIPELIIYTDYYKNSTAEITKNPFTLKIVKNGYEPIDTKFNLTQETSVRKIIHGSRSLYPINVKMVSGTTYNPGDKIDVEAKVTDAYGQPVDTATCTFNVYNPDKTTWLNGITSSEISGTGTYYNNSYDAPSTLGVYTYVANCTYDGYNVLDSKTFEITNASGSTTSSTTTTEKPGTTTYTCTGLYTQLENTSYTDGTYKLVYNKCANGCKDGYCVQIEGVSSYMNVTTMLMLILSGAIIALGRYFKKRELISKMLYATGLLIFLLTLWMYSIVIKSIPNILLKGIGEYGYSVSTILLIPLLLLIGFVSIYWLYKKFFKKRI